MNLPTVSLEVQPIQQSQNLALVLDLPGLAYDRAAGDVLHRALHNALFPPKLSLDAHDFTCVPFAYGFK